MNQREQEAVFQVSAILVIVVLVLAPFLIRDFFKPTQSLAAETEPMLEPIWRADDYETRLLIPPSPKSIVFSADGKMVGTIDFSKGKVTFTGEVDESARLFFEHVYKAYIAPYETARCNE